MEQTIIVNPESIVPGSKWRHHLGGKYTVLYIANQGQPQPHSYQPVVVYQGENGKVWTKTVPNFLQTMQEVKYIKISPWAENLKAAATFVLAIAACVWMFFVLSGGYR